MTDQNKTYVFLDTNSLTGKDWQRYNKHALYGTNPRFVSDANMQSQYLDSAKSILERHPNWQEHFEKGLYNKREHRSFCPEYVGYVADLMGKFQERDKREVFAVLTKYNQDLDIDREIIPHLVTAGLPKDITYDYIEPKDNFYDQVKQINDYKTSVVKFNDYMIITNENSQKYLDEFGASSVIDTSNGINSEIFDNFYKQYSLSAFTEMEAGNW